MIRSRKWYAMARKFRQMIHNSTLTAPVWQARITASDSIKHPVLFFYAYAHFRANLHPVENVMLPRREPIKGFFLKMPFPI